MQTVKENDKRNKKRSKVGDKLRSASGFCCFLAWFILRPWKWKRCVPLKRRSFSVLHHATAHITEAVVYINICRHQEYVQHKELCNATNSALD
jgi:hypothetical protein